MKLSIPCLAAITVVVVCGCSPDQPVENVSVAEVASSETPLRGDACRNEIDKADPNETPYLLCPGADGYTMIVRPVDTGRQSIEVVDAAKRTFPLDYQEYITRHMFELDDRAQWWLAARNGQQVPIALAVRVHAHEDPNSPEKVTQSYIAVAKITADQACVTERIADGPDAAARVRSAATSAPDQRCASPLPPMTVDGTIVR
jgi:hypothetical protein